MTPADRKRAADIIGWIMGAIGMILCGIALWGWALR